MIKMTFAAPRSGSGKTFITCAMIELLKERGLKVSSFKCGPDYIDPMFHRNALGIPSYNLDLFFTSEEQARRHLAVHSRGMDALVMEGVMGFYDGIGGTETTASTYHMAKTLNSPVILVVQPKGTSLTLAAEIKGLMDFREGSSIKGVILNQCSKMLYATLKKAIERECGIEVLGYVPHMEEANIKSRHLGLYTAGEISDINNRLKALAAQMKESIDIDRLIHLCRVEDEACAKAEDASAKSEDAGAEGLGKTASIGIAYDDAFCFMYQENLECLKKHGAELKFFSPLEDKELPEGISGIYIPGGYPEIYADMLEANNSMRKAIRNAVLSGMPTVAECGGFQYLGKTLEGEDGKVYEMAGAIEIDSTRKSKLVRFGYIDLTAKEDSLLFRKGESIRSHEFHYWDSSDTGCGMTATKPVSGRSWECCHVSKSLYAGYPHLYFPNNEEMAKRFAAKSIDFAGGNYAD